MPEMTDVGPGIVVATAPVIMRALLPSILVSAAIVLSVAAPALASEPAKASTTRQRPSERTWSGSKGNWVTTGKTRYLVDGMKHSLWNSRNKVTGETRSGTARSMGGYSSVAVATQNRAGQTTSVALASKSPGQRGTRTVR